MLAVVLVFRRTLDVHVPRVPVMIRRNRKHAPVQEDAQPLLPIPVRHRVGAERFPRRVIFPRRVHRVDFLQITLPIHCVLLSKMKRMNSLLKEYDKQVKNPCANAKKYPKIFPKIRAISPNACFFLDFSIVFRKNFFPAPPLAFFSLFACIMRVFSVPAFSFAPLPPKHAL